jgi:hypothetical protein
VANQAAIDGALKAVEDLGPAEWAKVIGALGSSSFMSQRFRAFTIPLERELEKYARLNAVHGDAGSPGRDASIRAGKGNPSGAVTPGKTHMTLGESSRRDIADAMNVIRRHVEGGN